MALQFGALREALIDAGASADKADRASEEVAGYKRQPDFQLLMRMVGGLYAVLAVLAASALWLLLLVASKVGAFG